MKITTKRNPPTWAPNAILSKAGWINPKNGEVYVAAYQLDENEQIVKESQQIEPNKQDKITISTKKNKKRVKKSNIQSIVESSTQPVTKDAFIETDIPGLEI